MKLAEHVDLIRGIIDKSFRNRFGRMGIMPDSLRPQDSIPQYNVSDRNRIKSILKAFVDETGSDTSAYEKLVDEFTFTLFNRLAAMKVMETHALNPEIITRRSQHGNRSFAHYLWLEQNPDCRKEELDGLLLFIESRFEFFAKDISLFSLQHPYHLLPTAVELNNIINAFNQVENDPQVGPDIWKSDNVLGWFYESYNNNKKTAHKDSKEKTEYDKVSLQSQVYTPRWVVKFLVDNSLGKMYMEMFPESEIRNKYKIANIPDTQTRDKKPVTEIRIIDPAVGSGNFLLYAFDLLYDLYMDQKNNYGVDFDEREIPELIINKNLYGIDLDDRAVQLTQLGLYIKAKRKGNAAGKYNFNIVSSDFFLAEYNEVKHLFENGEKLTNAQEKVVKDIWSDLQQAYKFGSLIRLEEKFMANVQMIEEEVKQSPKSMIGQMSVFEKKDMKNLENFRQSFFESLQNALEYNVKNKGVTFQNFKTNDALTFLRLLTQKYDVAAANPPYTDSADYGQGLKAFIEDNYKKPHKFNSNLYAAFIKRCYELIKENGYIALIHPHTYMYIKTFQDVRKFIIEKTHIDLLVDYGLDRVNLFGPGILLDATWYVLNKNKNKIKGVFFNITANQQEKYKKGSLVQVFDDYINNVKNERVYKLEQSKLKIIDGWPFIYWISDGFREKFKLSKIEKHLKAKKGLGTDNIRFFRFWWEIDKNDISTNYTVDKKKWVGYIKGGPFNKWYGNLWLVINWENNGAKIKSLPSLNLRNPDTYFNEGIACSLLSSKGTSFRYQPYNYIYDSTTRSIFLEPEAKYSLKLYLALLNTKIVSYILECLNSTVATNSEDIHRIPVVDISKGKEDLLIRLVNTNITIKKKINEYHIIEKEFKKNPLSLLSNNLLKGILLQYLNNENAKITYILTNEAVINKVIYEVYSLSPEDRKQVETKMGKPVGELPVLAEARDEYLKSVDIDNNDVKEFIRNLDGTAFDEQFIKTVKEGFNSLYQKNNDLEEFCNRHNVNPINVWYWFRESKILPPGKAHEIALEFIADACRTILMEDEDGIVPLVGLPDEPRLLDRLEQYCLNSGFTIAQFMQLDGLLDRPLNEYLEHHFFKNFSDHLNLFMYLPKTPFIWHLSSGPEQGFEAYIIIYKWNRDSLYKLKAKYVSKRSESLQYRLIQLTGNSTAQSQSERETIELQLKEIEGITQKLDELIAEGYDPELDDGVGKNIAPLQEKGLLRNEVLNEKQLEKYLRADW